MPDYQSRKPGFESPLLPFWNLGIVVVSTTTQFIQLYKWVPDYRQWWKCEWVVFVRNCCMARMIPREVELVVEWTSLPGGWSVKRVERSNGLDTVIYIRTYHHLKKIVFTYVVSAADGEICVEYRPGLVHAQQSVGEASLRSPVITDIFPEQHVRQQVIRSIPTTWT